jgi:hypothetical protein
LMKHGLFVVQWCPWHRLWMGFVSALFIPDMVA